MSDGAAQEALYETEYEIGQDNLQRWGMDIHHPVF